MDLQEWSPEVDPIISVDLLHLSKIISRGIFFFLFLGSSKVPTLPWQGCRDPDHTENIPWQFWNPKKKRDQRTFCPQTRAWGEFWCKCVHLEAIKQLQEGFTLDFPLLEITSSWSYLLVFIQAKSTLILISRVRRKDPSDVITDWINHFSDLITAGKIKLLHFQRLKSSFLWHTSLKLP